ncbi:MAG: polysaccharide biosynthesis/export family protein, partial [Planctomycetota bacterium]
PRRERTKRVASRPFLPKVLDHIRVICGGMKCKCRQPSRWCLPLRPPGALAILLCAGFAAAIAFERDQDRKSSACQRSATDVSPEQESSDKPEETESRQTSRIAWTTVMSDSGRRKAVRLCQTRCLLGVHCGGEGEYGELGWRDRRPVPWENLSQGEYIGPFRTPHVPAYRLRVGDELELIYRLTRKESSQPYELNVGDELRVESLIDPTLDRDMIIQPDGMITLRMLGQVRAAGRTVEELREELEQQYTKYYKVPAITVVPLEVNTQLEDLRAAVDSRYGESGGQTQRSRVTPDGTIQLPAIGSVPAQGLTLRELKKEVEERYNEVVKGMGVTPRLLRRADRYVYVVGEVRQAGRFTLEAPTTAMQAIALAGGWNNGGNLRQIVVFRRTQDWQLMATKLDLRGALLGERPCPADELWLRDSDIVVVPKSHLLRTNDFIDLLFTRGIYGVLPMQGISLNFQKLSSL